MASFPSIFLHFLFVGFFLLSCCSLPSHSSQTHHILKLESLLPTTVCSSLEESTSVNTTGAKIFHLHNPCSSILHLQNLNSKPPTLTQILLEDEARAETLLYHHRRHHGHHHPSNPFSTLTSIPAHSGRAFGTGNYVVSIGLGTPKKDFTVVFDTGSDLTWIQCQPCARQCYKQQDPIFDQTLSSSYANLTCSSPQCALIPSATGNPSGCSGTTCLYAIQYGDSSFSIGFVASETLTLSSDQVVENFLFGCGEKNDGLFGSTAGLLGLGRNRVSLISQSKNRYDGVFSYCLPSKTTGVGYLNLGADTHTSGVRYTPMVPHQSMASFYFVELVAIKLGGKALPIKPTIFKNPGIVVDSGTVVTRLPPTAYTTFRDAFRKLMAKYKSAPGVSILDTCFDLTGQSTVLIPTVELVFARGASIKVDASGILVVASVSEVCLAFAGNGDDSDIGILGNMQQKTYRIVYDNSKGSVGFGAGGCS